MLFVLSPAKALDYASSTATQHHTHPQFMQQSMDLIAVLREKNPSEIANLMGLSDKLTALNVARYEAFEPTCTTDNAKQAVLAFNGDVYEGLAAPEMSVQQLDWMQKHARILSGLYGVLRPLDLMQPYRLEMGTRLATDAGKNLYDFWGKQIAENLNTALQEAKTTPDGTLPVLVNLASNEYFKSVDKKVLQAQLLDIRFEDYKSGKYKVVSFYAKRARGMMLRYAVENKCVDVNSLRNFNMEGYSFSGDVSTEKKLVFRRESF